MGEGMSEMQGMTLGESTLADSPAADMQVVVGMEAAVIGKKSPLNEGVEG